MICIAKDNWVRFVGRRERMSDAMFGRASLILGLITIFIALPGIAILAVDRKPPRLPSAEDDAYLKDIQKWRAERLDEINGDNGWTTLVGLFWLNQGQNKFGSDPSNDIVLPGGRSAKFAGSLRLDKEVV